MRNMRTRIRARRDVRELERAIQTAATPSMRDELLALRNEPGGAEPNVFIGAKVLKRFAGGQVPQANNAARA